MNKNQKVIYEYNETEGIFHENIGDYQENTNGYRTICHTTYEELDKFKVVLNATTRQMFSDGTWEWSHGKPSLEEVRKLWDAFVK